MFQSCYKPKKHISMPGKLAIRFSINQQSTSDKVAIIVHIPTTAYAPVVL
jgi:hypothetical protein